MAEDTAATAVSFKLKALPADIFECILDAIPPSDKETLTTLQLTCKSIHAILAPRMWGNITVHTPKCGKAGKRKHKELFEWILSLKDDDRRLRWIKEIVVTCSEAYAGGSIPKYIIPWNEVVRKVLGRLGGLRKFTFRCQVDLLTPETFAYIGTLKTLEEVDLKPSYWLMSMIERYRDSTASAGITRFSAHVPVLGRNLTHLAVSDIYGSIERNVTSIAETLANSPNLRSLELAINLDRGTYWGTPPVVFYDDAERERDFAQRMLMVSSRQGPEVDNEREIEHRAVWRMLCKTYVVKGGKPLKLRRLKLGWPGVHLDNLLTTDYSFAGGMGLFSDVVDLSGVERLRYNNYYDGRIRADDGSTSEWLLRATNLKNLALDHGTKALWTSDVLLRLRQLSVNVLGPRVSADDVKRALRAVDSSPMQCFEVDFSVDYYLGSSPREGFDAEIMALIVRKMPRLVKLSCQLRPRDQALGKKEWDPEYILAIDRLKTHPLLQVLSLRGAPDSRWHKMSERNIFSIMLSRLRGDEQAAFHRLRYFRLPSNFSGKRDTFRVEWFYSADNRVKSLVQVPYKDYWEGAQKALPWDAGE